MMKNTIDFSQRQIIPNKVYLSLLIKMFNVRYKFVYIFDKKKTELNLSIAIDQMSSFANEQYVLHIIQYITIVCPVYTIVCGLILWEGPHIGLAIRDLKKANKKPQLRNRTVNPLCTEQKSRHGTKQNAQNWLSATGIY